MINKELELTLNQQNILENLARNLNISNITDNTAVKKIADTFETEMRNYSDATEVAISNGFLSTMDDDLFEQFASDFGLYRKRYSKLRIKKEDQAVSITVNQDILFSRNLINFIPFRKGDIVYSNSAITIKTSEDVIFDSVTSIVYPELEISLKGVDSPSFSIPYEAEYLITPKQSDTIPHTPSYRLTFNNTIGLAMVEESIDDFRLRVYEATYLASNAANSLITAVTKDVPLLYHVETNNIEEGRAIDVIYPYTYTLISNGFDSTLGNIIVPMIETSLASKAYYQNMVRVKEPKSLNIVIRAKYRKQVEPTQSVLDIICREFNRNYYTTKNMSVASLKDVIIDSLFRYNLVRDDLEIYFTSPDMSSEGLLLSDTEIIKLDIGRFLFLTAIEGTVDE